MAKFSEALGSAVFNFTCNGARLPSASSVPAVTAWRQDVIGKMASSRD